MLDSQANEPAAQPPAPFAQIAVNITNTDPGGGGTVRTLGGVRRTSSTGAEVTQIRCGTKGLSCYSKADPGQKVTMQAQADPGYEFAGWSGGACSGKTSVCTVTAEQTVSVGATFIARKPRAARVAFAVKGASVAVKWKASVGNGTLRVWGRITARARVVVDLRRPRGGPLLQRTFTLQPGPFEHAESLRRGRLLRGAKVRPGGFVVKLRGRAGRIGLPVQIRTLTVAAPAEGVVDSAWISSSRNGKKAKTLRHGVTEAWATFSLAAQPTLAPITVRWFDPQGRSLGSREKNNRPTIKTGIGGSVIPRGTWKAQLLVAGRLIGTRNVQIK